MRKDESGIREWAKHTRKGMGLRRQVNKANRRNVKNDLRRGTDGDRPSGANGGDVQITRKDVLTP